MIKPGLLLLAGALLTACGSGDHPASQSQPAPACPSPAAPAQTLPAARASTEADCFLAAVALPAGARSLKASAAPGLTTTPVEPACRPLVDESRLWTVAGPAPDVQAFLRSHPAAGMTVSGYTDGHSTDANGDAVSWVSEYPTGATHQDNQLVISVLAAGHGKVDVRADALVIPAGSACAGGGSLRSK